jgi:3-oxoadipate enol-lactonase
LPSQRRETGFAEVNGARLYYEVAGVGHPLVLLHAGIADCRMWDEQVDAFAERHRVVRYDLRGFGRSDMPPGPFAHHDDLRGLLRALGVARAHVLGLSLGGGVALAFALAYPEAVTALIPVAAGAGGGDPPAALLRRWEEIEAAAKAGDLARAVEIELQMWVDGPLRAPDQVDPTVRERVREMNTAIFRREARNEGTPRPLEPPAHRRLGEVRAPTLVIVGDHDQPATVAGADLLARGIAGAGKVVVPGVAHMVNMERPAHFNRLVLDFLQRL